MRKIIMILVVFMMFTIVNLENVHTYNYKWKEITIYVPENIEYLEFCYNSRQCEVPKEFQKLIYLNILLIRYWYDSIY